MLRWRQALIPLSVAFLMGCDDDPTAPPVPDPSDQAPVITAPPSVSGSSGVPILFGISVSDPDGDAIATLTADLSDLPEGSNANFSKSQNLTSGIFGWNPALADTGEYSVTFAASNALRAARATTNVAVVKGIDSPPVVTMQTPVSGFTGRNILWPFTINDSNGDVITFGIGGAVHGTAYSGDGTSHIEGELNWTGCKAGTFTAFLWARSGTPAQTDTAWTEIVVTGTADHYVDILDGPEHFFPDTLVIQNGETISFRSTDGRRHYMFDSAGLSYLAVDPGCESHARLYWSYTEPPSPRTYTYYCNTFGLHPQSETGVIIVNP